MFEIPKFTTLFIPPQAGEFWIYSVRSTYNKCLASQPMIKLTKRHVIVKQYWTNSYLAQLPIVAKRYARFPAPTAANTGNLGSLRKCLTLNPTQRNY